MLVVKSLPTPPILEKILMKTKPTLLELFSKEDHCFASVSTVTNGKSRVGYT